MLDTPGAEEALQHPALLHLTLAGGVVGRPDWHRLLRAGNRRVERMLYIAATTQIRLDATGCAYYRRKLADGKTRM